MSNQDYYGNSGGAPYGGQPNYNQGYNNNGGGGYPQQAQYASGSQQHSNNGGSYNSSAPPGAYGQSQPSYAPQQQSYDNRGHSPAPGYNTGAPYGGSSQPQYDNNNNYNNGQNYNHGGAPYGGPNNGPPGPDGPNGEKGLGATLVGGGGAAYAAHKAGAGFFGSTGAAIAGAIGANFIEHKFKKHSGRRD
ncbi:hypothetical protein BB8028_0006g06630 [Beauveria bassiana]|uniref:Nitrogen starvation-induced glutamine rich protein n=1 Tax=Beauveria bassiana TaxID=176275 RepID=A0A2S7YK07_BEABA|nr:hypothetical protein BB8028_0006g06630 [Beauveria bassiana]